MHTPNIFSYINKISTISLSILSFLGITLFAQEQNNADTHSSIVLLWKEANKAEQKNNHELALQYYKKILAINPNNKKALLNIEKIKKINEQMHQEDYEEARTSLLQDVDATWEPPNIEKNDNNVQKFDKKEDETDSASETLITKLNSLIIPIINLENATISEAIDYLRQQSCAFDTDNKGINIVLNLPPNEEKTIANSVEASETPSEPHIFLHLHDVPVYITLEYIAKQAGLTMRIDPYAVVLLPESADRNDFITKEYLVKTNFIPKKYEDDKKENLFPCSAKNYLEQEGVTFPEGSFANYLQRAHKLIVRNTKENIELVDILLAACQHDEPSQISIETKFIEVNQDQIEQLGLHWLFGGLQLGNSGIYMRGRGNSNLINTPDSSAPVGGICPTSDLQSGNNSIQENSIDAAIDHGSGSTETSHSIPGGFSISGVYNEAQFQATLRALYQKKGVNLMAAPHVTTKDGVKATVKIVDEFIYPTEYTPPQIPQSTTNSGGHILHEAPPTIAPAFPNSWTTKNLGVILEAKPTIGSDGYTIELELHPQLTDFDGFINYGSPINTVGYNFSATNASVTPFSSTLTTNTINQPVFTVREVNTSVTVWDGQTVVLGGLIREDIQKFEDKIPLLGDIPLAGRLFRSQTDKKLKKNLIIFVTPRILNKDGAPLHHLSS
ncbi:MAG: hypothetical protein ACOYK6_05395 [Chthoniobacterales bacterium]